MNIKQAKLRFTELTGLPAVRNSVYCATWSQRGYVGDWINYAIKEGYANKACSDARSANFWVSLVLYLESVQEAV
jgi:hypothetical protein